MVDLAVYDRVEVILDPGRNPHDESRLHEEDLRTLWFSVRIEDQSKSSQESSTSFVYTDCYTELLKTSKFDRSESQFPSLVSFIGQTGAGKSTLIKALISLEPGNNKQFTPVVGSNSTVGNPTSGDVHLYGDPKTIDSEHPLLFADCEGFYGGNSAPRSWVATGMDKAVEMAVDKLHGYFTECTIRPTRWFPERNGAAGEAFVPTRKFVVEEVYPRILYAFSDVICFVTEAANVAEDTLERLIKWADKSVSKTINQPALPHAIIIVNGTKSNPEEWLDEDVATKQMLRNKGRMNLSDPELRKIAESWRVIAGGSPLRTLYDVLLRYFGEIRVVYVPAKHAASHNTMYRQFRALRERIELESKAVQKYREDSWTLWDAEQLSVYFADAFEHFTNDLDRPFDFFKSSRKNNPIPKGFSQHISNLMRLMSDKTRDQREIDRRMASLVASYISIESVNSVTQRFSPQKIMQHYRPLCESAYNSYTDNYGQCSRRDPDRNLVCVNTREGHARGHQAEDGEVFAMGQFEAALTSESKDLFLDTIEKNFQALKEELRPASSQEQASYLSHSIAKHRQALAQEEGFWQQHVSNKTCFQCLFNQPDFTLPCGHSICETCVRGFGHADKSERHVFKFHKCDLCAADSESGSGVTTNWPWEIKLKPPTAGIRILAIDGGGVRGVIAVTILELIEREIGLGLPLHEFFDLMVGTSIGGIIALGLGRNYWTSTNCLEQFKSLAEGAFSMHFSAKVFGKWVMALWKDSIYRVPKLEAELKGVFADRFGPSATLFGDAGAVDVGSCRRSSIRVAVTATTAFGNSSVLMSNYNRKEQPEGTGIELYREDDPSKEVLTWEAARCTSAAPLYFKPYLAPNKVSYQDGGMKGNNPLRIACAERALLWPKYHMLDTAISIGTGHIDRGPVQPDVGSPPGFLARVWKATNDLIDGEISWRNLQSELSRDRTLRFYRFNIPLRKEELPALDDVQEVTGLEKKTRQAFGGGSPKKMVTRAARSLLANLFFLELDSYKKISVPPGLQPKFLCEGYICCRLRLGAKGQAPLVRKLRDDGCQFMVRDDPVDLPSELISEVESGSDFSLRVKYYSTSPESEKPSICLVFRGARERFPISGFPRTQGEEVE